MPEKEVWTFEGRKKIFLVDERNRVVKEIKDLGPLNKKEKQWIIEQPGVPYADWLKDVEKEEKKKKTAKKKK